MDVDGTELPSDEYDALIDGLPYDISSHHSSSPISSPVSSYIHLARLASSSSSLSSTSPITSCFQLNLQRSKGSLDNLFDVIHSGPPSQFVCLLQEPNTFNNRVTGVPDDCIALYKFSCRPRAAIIIHKDSSYTFLEGFSSPDFSVVRVHGKDGDVIYCSVYWAKENINTPTLIKDICDFGAAYNIPVVIGADANAHHTSWGSSNTNPRGRILHDAMSHLCLSVVNDGSPTFHDFRRNEALDVTLLNDQARQIFCEDWRVAATPSLSDHELITFHISHFSMSSKHSNRRTRLCKGNNLSRFSDKLEDLIQPHLSYLNSACQDVLEMNSKVDLLESIISKAERDSSKQYFTSDTASIKKLKNRWWNKNLTSLRQAARRTEARYRSTKSPTDKSAAKKASSKYKKELANSKTSNWRSFCSNIKGNPANLIKTLKNKRRVPNSIRKNGVLSNNPADTLNNLTDSASFSNLPPASSVPSDSLPECSVTPDADDLCSTICSDILMSSLVKSLKSKAPGPDNISNALLKQSWSFMGGPIVNICWHSLRFGVIPYRWQSSSGIFLSKPGRKDLTSTNSWRTLNLSSCILKLLEKAVKKYLEDHAKIDTSLDDNQLGFRKGRSTDEAIHKVVDNIEDALTSKKFALGLFFDVKGAFDNINFSSILHALEKVGVNPLLIRWIYSLVSLRSVIFSLKGVSLIKYILKGTPQGGILSPLLWNLVINGLLSSMRQFIKENELALGFADDLLSLLSGDDPNELIRRQQLLASHVNQWCADNGLSLSSEKTTMVLFTWKHKFSISEKLTLEGKEIKLSNNCKYLGVTLNDRLSWTNHISNVCDKAKVTLATARRLVDKNWGLSPDKCRYILNSIVSPTLLYASHVWAPQLKSCQKLQLAKVQNLGSRQSLVCPRYSSNAAMCMLTALEPIHLEAKSRGLKTLLRLKHLKRLQPARLPPRGMKYRSHTNLLAVSAARAPLLDAPCDRIRSAHVGSPPFATSISSDEMNIAMARDFTGMLLRADFSVFTDGSRMDMKVGAGYVIYQKYRVQRLHDDSWSLDPVNTVFQAEVSAILRASEYLHNIAQPFSTVSIYSDSLSAVMSLSADHVTSQIVMDTRSALRLLCDNKVVISLCWVKAHVGIQGNEDADQLAKAGTTNSNCYPASLPSSAFAASTQNILTSDIIANLQEKGNRVSCLLSPFTDHKFASFWSKLSRTNLRKVLAFLDNRAPLKAFLFKIGLADCPKCSICGEGQEDNYHLLFDCVGLTCQRLANFGHFSFTSAAVSYWHPKQFVGFVQSLPLWDGYTAES